MTRNQWLAVLLLETAVLLVLWVKPTGAFPPNSIITYQNSNCVLHGSCNYHGCREVGAACTTCTSSEIETICASMQNSQCTVLTDWDGCGASIDGVCEYELGGGLVCIGTPSTNDCVRYFCGYLP